MKVCFISTFRSTNTTDAANYSLRLANLLLEEGFEVKRSARGFSALSDISWADVLIISRPGFRGMSAAVIGRLMRKKVVSIYSRIERLIGPFARMIDLVQLMFSDRITSYTRDYAQSSRLLSRFNRKLQYILPPVAIPPVNEEKFQELIAKKGDLAWVGVIGSDPNDPIIASIKLKNAVLAYPSDDIGSFYRAIDCLLVAAVKKTDGAFIPQAEVMLFGKPVVVFDIPGVRIPVQITGMGKIAKSGNAQDLSDKIDQVLTNPNVVNEEKKEYANKIFDLNLFIREWRSLLSELA